MENIINITWKVSNVFSYLIHSKNVGTIDCHTNEVASRIVECVNACAGIEYPSAHIPAIRDEMNEIRRVINADINEDTADEVKRLVSQQKKLLHHLKKLLHMHCCEQEGLVIPTAEQWFQAVNEAAEIAYKIDSTPYSATN